LHALAAISDYPSRKPIQIESEELIKLIDGLAKALDSLAASLEVRTGPRELSDQSGLYEWLEKSLQEVPPEMQFLAQTTVENPKHSETIAWLFFHLKNVSDLTLAARNVVARLLGTREIIV
jgi:hypothetical protein